MREHFSGIVRNGKLTIDQPLRWAAMLARQDGKRVSVTVEREIVRRTLSQNAWYWSIIVPTVASVLSRTRDVPLSNDQAHYVLKSAFIGLDETPLGPVPKSSAALSTKEFAEYCDRIVAHAASEWGFPIPQPGERVEASLWESRAVLL
jgi:hypothetical protein